jgi:hypothetical protein
MQALDAQAALTGAGWYLCKRRGNMNDKTWVQDVPDSDFADLITILHAAGGENRVAPEDAWTRLENILTEEKERRFPNGMRGTCGENELDETEVLRRGYF